MPEITCDVVVIGAGPAGCAAALSAARNGARVVLVEHEKYPGGTVEQARLTSFCGFFQNDSASPELLNPEGISAEITETLKGDGYAPVKCGRVWLQPFPEHFMRDFFMPRLNAAASLEFLPQTTVNKVTIAAKSIAAIQIISGTSLRQIEPRTVIDCAGTGFATDGLPNDFYRENKRSLLQAAAIIFLLKNSATLDKLSRLKLLYAFKKAVADGELSERIGVTDFENGFAHGEIIGRVNLPDDTNEKQLQIIVEQDIPALAKFLQQNLAEFKHSTLTIPRKQLSHRIGLRLYGQYELTENDLLTGKVFADSHIRAAWPLEEWHATTGQTLRYLSVPYGIPDRSLTSASYKNLFTGGSVIAATPAAHSSARVCGTAFASGERAGQLVTAGLV